jgi:tetrahydromethanopterin S-methyltransferase subunit E
MPGREEIVDVITHRIGVASHPSVELLVNEVRVTTINFALMLEFEVKALTAVIRAGSIVALESGTCATTASIAVEGVTVASRTADFGLPVLVHLGDGIPLLPAQNPPQAPLQTGRRDR